MTSKAELSKLNEKQLSRRGLHLGNSLEQLRVQIFRSKAAGYPGEYVKQLEALRNEKRAELSECARLQQSFFSAKSEPKQHSAPAPQIDNSSAPSV